MLDCSEDIEVNATDITGTFSWVPPSFYDPMGKDLDIVSNYPSAEFTFPWGDHTVQYVATKTSNGLRTECTFQIKVRRTYLDSTFTCKTAQKMSSSGMHL